MTMMNERLDDRMMEGNPADFFAETINPNTGVINNTMPPVLAEEMIAPMRLPTIDPRTALMQDAMTGIPMPPIPPMQPAGEMLQERMADRQAGPLMPGGTFTGSFMEDPYNLFNVPFTNKFIGLDPVNAPKVGLPSGAGTYNGMSPDYMSAQLNFPSLASASDIQDILRRGGNPVSDFARTTTMGTGYQPSVYEPIQRAGIPIGSMGIQNQPMVDPVVAPVFDPSSFANTLLPPANQEMLYGNRQDWTGPLVNPFINPWAAVNKDWVYNYSNPNWIDARNDFQNQKLNDLINAGTFALNPIHYLTNNLFDRFIR
tara:strand:- start:1169 stop:2110 length:942 start_codon:yes stop_codon:yes gene_type:complete